MDTTSRAQSTGSAIEDPLLAYGVTLFAVLVALAARWGINPYLGDHLPFVTFFAAIAVATWVGGIRTALVAIGLGLILSIYCFIPPRFTWTVPSGPHLVGLVMFGLTGVIIGIFGEAMRLTQISAFNEKERLRVTLTSIGDGVITTDNHGRVTNLNSVAEVLTGWTNADAVGQPLETVFRIINETTRQPVENPALRALREGTIVGLANHTLLIAREGTERPIDDSAAPIRCKVGTIVGCVLVFRDITERKLAEQALHQQTTMLRAIANTTSDLIYMKDRECRLVFANPATLNILGRPSEQTIGAELAELYSDPSEAERTSAADRRIMESGQAEVLEEQYTNPSGTRVYLSTKTPLLNEHGEVVGLIGISQDITARKRSEENLRETAERLQLAMDAAELGGWDWDITTGTVVWTPKTRELLGLAADAPATFDLFRSCLHPDDQAANDRHIETSLTSGHFQNEFRVRRPDGSYRWVASRARVYADSEGRNAHMLGVVMDVHERRQAAALQAGQGRILERVATGAALAEVLSALCLLIEEQEAGLLCAVVVPTEQRQIGLAVGGSLPEGYLRGLRAVSIDPPYLGPCSEALDTGKSCHISDVSEHHAYASSWVEHLLNYGMRSCRSIPVLGKEGTVLASFAFYRREVGDPEPANKHLIGVATQLTAIAIERKRAEDHLRESEQRLASILDQLPVGVSTLTLEGRVTLTNPIMRRYMPNAIPSLDPDRGHRWRAWGPDGRPLDPCDWPGQRGMRGETVVPGIEFLFTDDSGRELWTSVATSPLRDSNGTLVGSVLVLQDIDERKQAESRLRQSEERLRQIVESARDYAIFTLSLSGQVTSWNTGAQNLLGYTEAEIIGQSGEILYPLEDRQRDIPNKELQQARFEGRAINERWHVRKDGSKFWASGLVMPLRNHEQLSGFLKIMRDRTEAVLAEQRLQESERQFRLLADAMPQIVYVIDKEGALEFTNQRWREYTGLPATQTLDLSEVVHPDDLLLMRSRWEEAQATGCTYTVEFRLRRSDGVYRWYLARAVPTTNDEGQVVRWYGTSTDIHDMKDVEATLRYQSTLTRSITDNATTAIFMMDDKSRCTFMNPAAEEMTGFAFHEVEGGILHEFIHHHYPDGRPYPMPDCPIDRALPEGDEVRNHEDVFFRKNGESFPVMVNARVIYNADAPVGTVIEVRDITAERVAANQLRGLMADLSEADRMKDEFLATLAHELRNPLAPLRNGLHLLKTSGADDEMRSRARLMMERQLEHMVRLIDDLMDVARINRGQIALRLERVELASVVHQAVDVSRPLIESGNHTFTLELPEEPIELDADPTRLSQVVANLLNNAAKYTPEGGRIELTVQQGDSEVVLRVKDNGIGIPPAMLKRVFDMFTQVDRSLEKAKGGLGIGLSLVKKLVEMHKGTVEAFSDGSGNGSEFMVTIPIVRDVTLEATSPPLAPDSIPPRRILLADDNEDSASSMTMLLELLGNEVRTAYDGQEAVDMAVEYQPDLVLLDIGMPKLSGLEVCRRIRQMPWGQKAILVALTGWGQEENRRQTTEAGFDFHLVKPVDIGKLEHLLASLDRSGS